MPSKFCNFLIAAFCCIALFASPAMAQEDGPETVAVETTTSTTVELANQQLDQALGSINKYIETGVFFDVSFGFFGQDAKGNDITTPLVLIVLVFGAFYFTFFFKFINFRGFFHGIELVRGKYDDPNDEGDVSHFKALTAALSATVGLGNIAGVAIAIQLGGPGAIFWMTLLGLLGMSTKFVECTLGQMFRRHNPDGSISGGPMYYLEQGLRQIDPLLGHFGKVLAVIFAFMVMGGAIGAGNMFQSNQSYEALSYAGVNISATTYGVILMILVAFVIIGGIQSIANVTSRVVPLMAVIYILASLVIIGYNITEIPSAVTAIASGVFDTESAFGGFVGVLIQGVRRAAFSNEAGLGSAAIAHSAAKTKEPVREGFVALLEPFIDTVVICNMTALVIILTGVYQDPSIGDGIIMTKVAFESVLPWFPTVLAICVVLFAYSTMISWAYYGERGWIFLFDHIQEGLGERTLIGFRIIFVGFVYIGAVANLRSVLLFSDLLVLSMALPNIVGCIILAPLVAKRLDAYWQKYKAGEVLPMVKDHEVKG